MVFKKNVLDAIKYKDAINRLNAGGTFDTSIDLICHETGEYIVKGLHNKVVLAGSGFIARALFDILDSDGDQIEEITKTYNNVLGLEDDTLTDATDNELMTSTAATSSFPKVLLFCVGTDGCGTANNEVFVVSYKSWIPADSIIPFRYPLVSMDDTAVDSDQRQLYFGRKTIDSTYVAYYFKGFDVAPKLIQQYIIDATPITEDVYDDTSSNEVESYVEIKFSLTKEDLREYFEATTGLDDAHFNSVSLCYTYPMEGEDGYVYYQDIRPLTKLNIPNETMIDLTKGVDFTYHIYL